MNYTYWKAALAGEKAHVYVDDPQLGFYRKGIYKRDERGNKKRTGWDPVAIWINGTTLVLTHPGGDTSDRDRINEVWSYCCANPISEEWYRAVSERGEPWPDNPAPPEIPAANREVTKEDNAAPEVMTSKDHATGIDNAIGAAPKKIASEADAALALGSKNRIAELRLAADKAGKALYDPPYREYKRLHGEWSPMVAKADTAEKAIQKDVLTFRESERKRIAKEQEDALAKQRDIDEANERAAQRSIAAGEPELLPEVVEIEMPLAPAPIQPTYGTRKLKEEVKFFLDKVTSWDLLFAHYKNNAEVQALLMKLAGADIKAGHSIPGTTTREGLI
jgi:hypothetical protein